MQLQMSHGLQQTQRQQLTLNAGMIQSLEILKMPLQELSDMVAQAICENPMLEMDTPAPDDGLDEFEPVPAKAVQADEMNLPLEERSDPEPADITYRDIWYTSSGSEQHDPFAGQAQEQTFTEMLLEQVGAQPMDAHLAELCRYLIECLDTRGYLDMDPADLAHELDVPFFDIMQALYFVQSLQPAGVGARSLQECLVLQLVEGEHFNHDTLKLVKEGLGLLAAGDMDGIAALLECGREQAEQACGVVRGLQPIPSRGYYTGNDAASVVPDVVVRWEDDHCRVIMNDRAIPRLELSNEYSALLQNGGDAQLHSYLKDRLMQAKSIMKAVSERDRTLTAIVRYIVDYQRMFFRDGYTLRPMTMAMVADALDMHTSTVSRAVHEKYIVCAAGTVPMKSLFTASVRSMKGEAMSAGIVKQQLKKCIDAESPDKPLSDEDLRQVLQTFDIDISRRTVAKYREELGIPSSMRRKKQMAGK